MISWHDDFARRERDRVGLFATRGSGAFGRARDERITVGAVSIASLQVRREVRPTQRRFQPSRRGDRRRRISSQMSRRWALNNKLSGWAKIDPKSSERTTTGDEDLSISQTEVRRELRRGGVQRGLHLLRYPADTQNEDASCEE